MHCQNESLSMGSITYFLNKASRLTAHSLPLFLSLSLSRAEWNFNKWLRSLGRFWKSKNYHFQTNVVILGRRVRNLFPRSVWNNSRKNQSESKFHFERVKIYDWRIARINQTLQLEICFDTRMRYAILMIMLMMGSNGPLSPPCVLWPGDRYSRYQIDTLR